MNIIDAIIIDTSVLEKYQFDFIGCTSRTLTSFYDLLIEKNIYLLNHFVLDNEIKKHISNSAIIERTEQLEKSLWRNKDFFKLIGIPAEESIEKLKNLELKQTMLAEYVRLYSEAKMLPFTDPENVFMAYFNEEPPFNSSNDKKSEFPDAFIISAVKEYVKNNEFTNVLVVSDDLDWQNSFKGTERISVCNSIDNAILTIQNADRIVPIIEKNTEEILETISLQAECEAYFIPEYGTADDVYITSVAAEKICDIIPLKISTTSVLFKCFANLKVDGTTRIIDVDSSHYDKEDGMYDYLAYSDIEFENADACVECEINLNFSSDNSENLVEAKIVTKFDIELDLDDAEITTTACSEDELALECLREDKGYYITPAKFVDNDKPEKEVKV